MKKYEHLFLYTFTNLKGIHGDLSEIKIVLKHSKPMKHQPYRLNIRVKEKVKRGIDIMLVASLIFIVDEFEWMSLIKIQNKKDTKDIRVCADYHIFISTCIHDPFPIPFNDEDFDKVAKNESYSFKYGFSEYHQVWIAKEDKNNTTFTTEWGSCMKMREIIISR